MAIEKKAVIREEVWKKLSPDQQRVLIDAGNKAMEYSMKLEAEGKEAFKKKVQEAPPPDMEGQVRAVFKNIKLVLDSMGALV